jgi:hypothetical protein
MLRRPAARGDRPKPPAREPFLFTRAPGWEGAGDGTGPNPTQV